MKPADPLTRNGKRWWLAWEYIEIFVARMSLEERLVHEHFGAEYDAHCARTAQLVQWVD